MSGPGRLGSPSDSTLGGVYLGGIWWPSSSLRTAFGLPLASPEFLSSFARVRGSLRCRAVCGKSRFTAAAAYPNSLFRWDLELDAPRTDLPWDDAE
jgi:hypothetical protein